ncbi:MAG TPA: alpha/beta hydrolase family protein [Gemmatimonadaceae bacterium]|nr:alpha/beta hydrolase family protein [Gemmatimonadaceae bacterium]
MAPALRLAVMVAAVMLAALAGAARVAPAQAGKAAARGTVHEGTFWSQVLGTRKRYVVYLPPSYGTDSARRYPVAYYLHGLWGDETNWVRLGHLDAAMDSLAAGCAAGRPCGREMIVVMPDGDDGWYTTWNFLGDWAGCRRTTPRGGESVDAYCVPWPKYDDYIARDLVAHIDSTYRTIPARERRGIAGLSMGGYGAVTLALRYPDVFSAAASHSGVLSPLYAGPSPFAPPPTYARRFGGAAVDTLRARAGSLWPTMKLAFGRDTIGWVARDPARLARRAAAARRPLPFLMLDVGRGDRLTIEQNRAFRHELRALGIPHRYAEWDGAHDWTYWRTHVGESLAWLAERLGDGMGGP